MESIDGHYPDVQNWLTFAISSICINKRTIIFLSKITEMNFNVRHLFNKHLSIVMNFQLISKSDIHNSYTCILNANIVFTG